MKQTNQSFIALCQVNWTNRKLNNLMHNYYSFMLIVLLLFSGSSLIAQNIITDEAVHDAGTVGNHQDLVLPNDNSVKSIAFILNGGDGGYAEVKGNYVDLFDGFVVYVSFKSKGGDGAEVQVEFPVGTPSGIPIGSMIRFVKGGKGSSGNVDIGNSDRLGFSYAGGGGGSAVLYDPPGSQGWTLLAVAGGGGGAAQSMNNFIAVNSSDGQGGRAAEGSGEGGKNYDLGGLGGGGGGGANGDGDGLSCSLSGTETGGGGGKGETGVGSGGGTVGCPGNSWVVGGDGYGGGGVGAASGGGGGGYTGGDAAGPDTENGGGGSFASFLATTKVKTDGGTVASPENGSITYQVTTNHVPIAQCQPATIYLNASGEATLTSDEINDGSSDPDDETDLVFSLSQTSFNCSNIGQNTITLTVTDKNGADGTCEATVTVADTVSPIALCKNLIVQLNEVGSASIIGADIDDGSYDGCGIASLAVSPSSFTCSNIGQNTVTMTVTDNNGNTKSCTSTVTVEDNDNPIVHTRDVELILDKYGQASIDADEINNNSTDNCNTFTHVWLEGQTEFDCGNTGIHEVVLKARDQKGNVGSSTARVTVKFYEPDFEKLLGIKNGDTLNQVNCQVPRDITLSDEDLAIIKKYGTLRSNVFKVNVPDNAPWSQYAVWRHELVMEDACAHIYRITFYQALYDLDPPVYQYFPNDTTVTSAADLPEVDMDVKIIDICQYVAWDTVETTPVMDQISGDTVGYTRRWMARDPSGHESFRDQMIWIGSGNRNQYALITGRIASDYYIPTATWAGEAGTNGIPVSLYRIDTVVGTRTLVGSQVTGDWMGAQGTYYFTPEHPGIYQVKIDSAICLVDTLKFNQELWSDALEIAAGDKLDQGLINTQPCPVAGVIDTVDNAEEKEAEVQAEITPNRAGRVSLGDKEWILYPNPAQGFLRIDIHSDKHLNYQLFDALGRSVKRGSYQQNHTIDVSGIKSGLYYIQLRENQIFLGMKRIVILE